jgi:tRNA dimethylallyltransferase
MIRTHAIAVVGATATGKTGLAETLAGAFDAEVVCADSRQVFAELEIGTGRPTPAERAGRPHHLFAALHLGQHASAGWYARAAEDVYDGIRGRGRPALLVGGSGLYLRAFREGLAATPPHDAAVRARLHAEFEARGGEALHERLAAVDPASAARLDPRDRQRVSRALEVYEGTGRPLSWWHAQTSGPAPLAAWMVIELVVEPAELRGHIARRTTWMFDHGLVEETRALLAGGHGEALRELRAIGYDEATELIGGRLDRAGAEARVNQRTAQLAKRQRTWFRHQIEAVRLDTTGQSQNSLARAAIEILRAAGVPGL